MAPEQAWGENDIDQRADVWAFAVMLYELLTGTTPFHGDSYNALLYAITRDEPKSLVEHGVDEPELWHLVSRCLAKDRDGRFPDMRELGRALAEWLLLRGVKTDITKAPLSAWLQAKPALDASLFPMLARDSTDPPMKVVITRVGEPEPFSEPMEPPKVAEYRPEPTLNQPADRPRLRAALRLSLPRRRSRSEADGRAGERKRSGLSRFVAIALLSSAAFLGAAYWQSRHAKHAPPAATLVAPTSVGGVPAPGPALVVQLIGDAPPLPESEASEPEQPVATASAAPSSPELRPDKPRAAVRLRAKKAPASSADLKNPFE
jgi:serine/threonine-protein kinase